MNMVGAKAGEIGVLFFQQVTTSVRLAWDGVAKTVDSTSTKKPALGSV